jgi:hypothetical protein
VSREPLVPGRNILEWKITNFSEYVSEKSDIVLHFL